MSDLAQLQLYRLGLLTALLPLFTTHICLLLSGYENYLAWCNPYWLDCHSISATGRQGTAYFVFKGGMIIAMVLLALYWLINQAWLQGLTGQKNRALGWCGSLASAALIIYTLSLGHDGNIPYLLRRSGVITYLGLTFICQLLLASTLARQTETRTDGRRLFALSAMTLLLALFSLLLDASLGEQYQRLENAVEWGLILMLNLHVLLSVWAWKNAQLQIRLHNHTKRTNTG